MPFTPFTKGSSSVIKEDSCLAIFGSCQIAIAANPPTRAITPASIPRPFMDLGAYLLAMLRAAQAPESATIIAESAIALLSAPSGSSIFLASKYTTSPNAPTIPAITPRVSNVLPLITLPLPVMAFRATVITANAPITILNAADAPSNFLVSRSAKT